MTLGVVMAGCPSPQDDYDDYLKLAQKPAATAVVPTSKCPVADVNGLFVGYCKVNFATPEQSLMLRTEFTLADGKISADFKPLKNSTTGVGPTSTEDIVAGVDIKASGTVTDNQFTLTAGDVSIPGAANPLSGTDILLTGSSFKAFTVSTDIVFAELDGTLVKPFENDLTQPGDTCIFVRATGTAIPARPDDELKTPALLGSGCPDEGASGAGGSGGSGGSGS